jgi:hypothetical protein
MGVVADDEVVSDRDARGLQLLHLLAKSRRVDYDAVADHGRQARFEDAGRKERKFKSLSATDDSVTSVGAAVVPDDKVMAIAEQVDDLSFGFVAPLEADHARASHV